MIYKIFNKKTFLTAFLATIIIHGEMLFNKIAWHDEVGYLYFGWMEGLMHGRWFQYLMAKIMRKFSGMESTSLAIGLIVAVCIGLMACLFFQLFEIKKFLLQFPLIIVFCAIPAVAGHFGYIGSSGYDFIGKLICVISAYILCKGYEEKYKLITFVLSSVLLAVSLGEYQCYLTFFLCLVLTHFTMVLVNEDVTWMDFWKRAFMYVAAAAIGLIIYLGVLNIFLEVFNQQLTGYAGTDTYGIVGISKYIERLILAYSDFVSPNLGAQYNMFPFHWRGWHMGLLLVLFSLMIVFICLKLFVRQYRSVFQCLIAFALLPLALNFNFVLYGAESTHSLHMYQFVVLFIYLYVLVNGIVKFVQDNQKSSFIMLYTSKIMLSIVAVVVLLFGLLYVRYDNYCYTVAEIKNEAAKSYFTSLITRIQSVDGYDDEYPVAFINEFEKKTIIDSIPQRYDYLTLNSYSAPVVNSYTWKAFMARWCGYEPEYEDATIYLENEQVKEMPSYPDDGSIAIIDDVVVVKF